MAADRQNMPSSDELQQAQLATVDTLSEKASVLNTRNPEALEPGLVENGGGESVELIDGGVTAWMTVLGSWINMFTGFGYSDAFGVYQDYYVREFLSSQSSSQISWIGSTQFFLMMSLGIFTGRLFDKGYFYHLVILGSFLFVLSIFMLSLAKPDQFYQVFLAQGLLYGLGCGMTYVPSIAVIAQHFRSPQKRAIVMGIVASGSSLGGVIHPIMLNNLLHGSLGFAGTVRASAGFLGGLQLIALCLMRAKYPKRGKQDEKIVKLKVAFRNFVTDLPSLCTVAAMFLFSQGLFFPLFYLQLDAIKHGIDSNLAFYSISIMNATSFVGDFAPGYFSRFIGVPNTLIVICSICAILVFSMFGVRTAGGVAAFAALYGFFSGAYVASLPPMLALLADDPAEIGVRMGFCYAMSGLGSLIGTPITGALLTSRFVWWQPILYSGLVCIGGCAFFAACQQAIRRKREMVLKNPSADE